MGPRPKSDEVSVEPPLSARIAESSNPPPPKTQTIFFKKKKISMVEKKKNMQKREFYPENSTMKGNPLYAIIDSLVFLVGPDAVLLELPPD